MEGETERRAREIDRETDLKFSAETMYSVNDLNLGAGFIRVYNTVLYGQPFSHLILIY